MTWFFPTATWRLNRRRESVSPNTVPTRFSFRQRSYHRTLCNLDKRKAGAFLGRANILPDVVESIHEFLGERPLFEDVHVFLELRHLGGTDDDGIAVFGTEL